MVWKTRLRETHWVSVWLVLTILAVLGSHAGVLRPAAARAGEAPTHVLSSDGFVRDWLILGSFPNPRDKLSAPDGGYHTDYLQSLGGEERAVLTPDMQVRFVAAGERAQIAKTRRAQTASSGVFHFDTIFGRTDYELAYAFCYIRSDREQQVTAYFGSNDDAKIWVNGELVHESAVARSCTARQDTLSFRLKAGLNPILIKVCERWGDWAFVIEVFTDEFLERASQRPLARALHDIRQLDLRLKGFAGDVFPVDLKAFPEVQWENPYQAEKLLGEFPLHVRWFDSQGKEASEPPREGVYTALVEGESPDGILVRRAKRFHCGDKSSANGSQDDGRSTAGWKSRSRFPGSGSEESIVELTGAGADGALGISHIAERKGRSRKASLLPGKHAGLLDRSIRKGQSCLYWLYLPEGYGKQRQKWPMILVLHGSFQQGRSLERIGTPIPPRDEDIRKRFPFVVVTPQCPDEYDAWPSELLADLIDEVVLKYDVDARRVSVTGISLGGRGSWSVACDYPERFAAIVPVCGTYDHPERIHWLKEVPVWAFHGDRDTVVPFAPVKKMVEDLKAGGGNVRFTVYEGAGHGISGRAYRTKELYEWLLKQRND